MIRIRASQIFTRDVESIVRAKKSLDDGTPFIDAVASFSECPSKKHAGDLGWMSEEGLVQLLGNSLTEKDKGRIFGPIHSPYGYHLVVISDLQREENTFVPSAEEWISPEMLKERIQAPDTAGSLLLLDIREPWERDIASIHNSVSLNRDNCESVLGSVRSDTDVVVIDWRGERGPSFLKWLKERDCAKARILAGGIDAWAERIDTKLARYDIDMDDGYRYEDIAQQDHHDHDGCDHTH